MQQSSPATEAIPDLEGRPDQGSHETGWPSQEEGGSNSLQSKSSGSQILIHLLTIFQIDVNKANRIYDFMIHSGWLGKA